MGCGGPSRHANVGLQHTPAIQPQLGYSDTLEVWTCEPRRKAYLLTLDLTTLTTLEIVSKGGSVSVVKLPKTCPRAALKVRQSPERWGERRPWLEVSIHSYLSSCKSGLLAQLLHHQPPAAVGGHHLLLMEYCQAGSLFDLLQRRERRRMRFGDSLFLAVDLRDLVATLIKFLWFLQLNDVIHCNLKPEHVVIDEEGAYKMIDWGAARYKDTGRWPGEGVCTSGYVAPEYIKDGCICLKKATSAQDVYSVGIIVLEAILGVLQNKETWELMESVRDSDRLPDSITSRIRPDLAPLADLVRGLLSREPETRMFTVQSAPDHIYFEGFVWGAPFIKATGAPRLHAQIAELASESPQYTCFEIAEKAAELLSKHHAEEVRQAKKMLSVAPSSAVRQRVPASSAHKLSK